MGNVLLLVSATVMGDTGDVGEYQKVVTLDNVQVLAGNAANGIPSTVVETATGDRNLLPPGQYILALGAASGQPNGTYFLSLGLQGSFIAQDGQAIQRCPDYNAPGTVVTAVDAVSVETLVGEFAAAFGSSPQSPLSPATSS